MHLRRSSGRDCRGIFHSYDWWQTRRAHDGYDRSRRDHRDGLPHGDDRGLGVEFCHADDELRAIRISRAIEGEDAGVGVLGKS